MDLKTSTNKWKTLSKSVAGVLATKIATDNPEKQLDNLKAFLERTKKQLPELSSLQGARETLEERLLKAKAILITFEERKAQLDNVLAESVANELKDSLMSEWLEKADRMKNVVQDLQRVVDDVRLIDEICEQVETLLTQLQHRRESCCDLSSAIDATNRIQVLRDEGLTTCQSLVERLRNAVKSLSEKTEIDAAVLEKVEDLTLRMKRSETELKEVVRDLAGRTDRERRYKKLVESFRVRLDEGFETLKSVRNEECDTNELRSSLASVKNLQMKNEELQKQLATIQRETASLNVERYTSDLKHVLHVWNTYCNELDSCEEKLETSTNESKSVVHMLTCAVREILKKESQLEKLKRQPANDKQALTNKLDIIKGSIRGLKEIYDNMETFTHQWEKLKKNGLNDESVEAKLSKASEKLNSLQADFQELEDECENVLNTVERVDEDNQKAKRIMEALSGYLSKIRLNSEDTNSDIQAKLSKIDQKLCLPCWDLIENVESLIENLPPSLTKVRAEVSELKCDMIKLDKDFDCVRTRLSDALLSLNRFTELCTDLRKVCAELKATLPNLKKVDALVDKMDAMNKLKSIERKLSGLKGSHLNEVASIQSKLELDLCKKPMKEANLDWKELLQTCLDSMVVLAKNIAVEQSKANKRNEFAEWIESTNEMIEQMTTQTEFNTLDELHSYKRELKVLQSTIKCKNEEVHEIDDQDDKIKTQLSEMHTTVYIALENLEAIDVLWSEFETQAENLTEWLQRHNEKFSQAMLIEKLKERLFTLKELDSDLGSHRKKFEDFSDISQVLIEKANSRVLQQYCSILNNRSQLLEVLEMEIGKVDRWLFIRNQLRNLHQRIMSAVNKLASFVISGDDFEDQASSVEELSEQIFQHAADVEKFMTYEDRETWPLELRAEFDDVQATMTQLDTELETKRRSIAELIINYETEQHQLLVAKSRECSPPAVFETADELNVGFELHYIGAQRRASLKLNKFSKYKNAKSNSFLKRRSSKLLMKRPTVDEFMIEEATFDRCSSSAFADVVVDESLLYCDPETVFKFHVAEAQVEFELYRTNLTSLCSMDSIDVCLITTLVESERVELSTVVVCPPTVTPSEAVTVQIAESLPMEVMGDTEGRSLWEKCCELARRVRRASAASSTMQALLEYLADVHRLWLAHGDFDFYDFDAVDLHQSIQFLQLDILQLIEDHRDVSCTVDFLLSEIC